MHQGAKRRVFGMSKHFYNLIFKIVKHLSQESFVSNLNAQLII